jgi:hypothetical protein
MNSTPTLSGLPEPPAQRELPGKLQRRRELQAMIQAGGPAWRAGRTPHRWAIPLAAAAAVTVVVVAAALLAPAVGRHLEPGGSPTAPPASGRTTTVSGSCPVLASGQCQRTSSYVVTAPVRSLTVTDQVGQVTITGSDRGTVSVTERLTYTGIPPVTRSIVSGGALALSYRCQPANCGVAYDILVPRTLPVTVSAGVGQVWLNSLAGPVRARAGTGSMNGQDLSGGTADLGTGVGSITASFSRVPSRITATTGTGSVTLRVPATAAYAVTASAGLGSVSVGVPRSASSGHVIRASAGVGSVTVASG